MFKSVKYGNRSRLSIQHDWRNPYDHLLQMRTLTFDIEYDIHISFENHEGNGDGYNVDLLFIMY